MSLIQKLYDAQEKKDLEKINEILSEDYVWVQHSTGKHIPRDEVNKFIIVKKVQRLKVSVSFMKMMK